MRALTVIQPHASAIALGLKRFEFRNWPPPPDIRAGAPFALHAGKALDKTVSPDVLQRVVPNTLDLDRAAIGRRLPRGLLALVKYEREATPKELRRITRWTSAEWPPSGNFKTKFVWRLKLLALIQPPIVITGGQKFWTLPVKVARVCEEFLAGLNEGAA